MTVAMETGREGARSAKIFRLYATDNNETVKLTARVVEGKMSHKYFNFIQYNKITTWE